MNRSNSVSRIKVMPVRPYNRFGKGAVADTGIDPTGGFRHFIAKDPAINLDVHRDRKRYSMAENAITIPKGQVPSGTTKCTYRLGLDTEAKLQRDERRFSPAAFPRNPTDVVSSEPPPR